MDLSGSRITLKLDLENIIATIRRVPKHPKRIPLITATEPALAEKVLKLLKKK